MATVYKSKIDRWLLIVLVSAMVASLYASATIVLASSPSTWWLLALTAGIGIGLPLWLLLATNYTLEPRQLLVRSGPFKWKVPIKDITSITATSNPLSSPALSLDRLRIEYGRGSAIMVSPRNKDQFLRDIEALRRDVVGPKDTTQ
jgi:membrane protein YdbS with pleckstrin-like domain